MLTLQILVQIDAASVSTIGSFFSNFWTLPRKLSIERQYLFHVNRYLLFHDDKESHQVQTMQARTLFSLLINNNAFYTIEISIRALYLLKKLLKKWANLRRMCVCVSVCAQVMKFNWIDTHSTTHSMNTNKYHANNQNQWTQTKTLNWMKLKTLLCSRDKKNTYVSHWISFFF